MSDDEVQLLKMILARASEMAANAGCNDVPREWLPHLTAEVRERIAAHADMAPDDVYGYDWADIDYFKGKAPALVQQVRALRAIVATLPLTEDGVPMRPGMPIWLINYAGLRHVTVTQVGMGYVKYDDPEEPGIPFGFDVAAYKIAYADRAKAEAAQAAQFPAAAANGGVK